MSLSEGTHPRIISAAEVEAIVAGMPKAVTATLTDAQIKQLPNVPFVVLPATEIYNYDVVVPATQLFIPTRLDCILDTRAGTYAGMSNPNSFSVQIGSDASYDTGELVRKQSVGNGIQVVNGTDLSQFFTNAAKSYFSVVCCVGGRGGLIGIGPGLQDNAISIYLDNGKVNLTGGNPANTLKMILSFIELDL
jgi:hypothetical protein